MEDEVTLSLDGKNLNNLRVVDLKLELEKRGLSKSGSKKDLVKRLKQQLEFEKLCEESKSTGDCDLKKELDAATEQNEFVQRYLAQQQKIFAEQKEVKRLVELEETQKRSEEKDSLSPHAEEDQTTEESDTEPDETSDSLTFKKNETESIKVETDKKDSPKIKADQEIVPVEKVNKTCLTQTKDTENETNTQSIEEHESNKNKRNKNLIQKTEDNEKNVPDKIVMIFKKGNDVFDLTKNVNETDTSIKSLSLEHEKSCEKETNINLISKNDNDSLEKSKDIKSTSDVKTDVAKIKFNIKKDIDKTELNIKKDSDKTEVVTKEIDKTELKIKKDIDKPELDTKKYIDKTELNLCKSAIISSTENTVVTDKTDKISEEKTSIIHLEEQSKSSQSTKLNLGEEMIDVSEIPFPSDSNCEKYIVESKYKKDLTSVLCEKEVSPSKEGYIVKNRFLKALEKKDGKDLLTSISSEKEVSFPKEGDNLKNRLLKSLEKKEGKDLLISISCEKEVPLHKESDNVEIHALKILERKDEKNLPTSVLCKKNISPAKEGDDVESCLLKTQESPIIADNSTLSNITSVIDHKKENKMDQNVPYSLSDIQLPESSGMMETSEKVISKKETHSPGLVREEDMDESHSDNADHKTQSNGVSSLKESKKECLKSDLSTNECSSVKDKISQDLKRSSFKSEREKSNDRESKAEQVKSKNKSSLKPTLEKDSSKSESKSLRKKEPVKKYNSSETESSSTEESSEESRHRSSKRRSSPKQTVRRKRESSSSTESQSSESRESSPEKSSSTETGEKLKNSERSVSPVTTKTEHNEKDPGVSPNMSDGNSTSSKIPPRKKLKINRNNVIIPSVPKDSLETSNSKTVSEKSPKTVDEKSSSEEHRDPDPESPPPSSGETEREMGEIIENYPEIKYEPRKLNFPGRKQSRKSTEEPSSDMPKTKKSKWGKFATSQKTSQTINISTDSLKNWFPDFKLVNEPAAVVEMSQEDSPLVKDDKKPNFSLNIENDMEVSQDQKAAPNIAQNVTSESASIENRDPSTPVSKIVFVQNLVRPFTLLQLKEFLRQNGNMIEEQFWIDKIKSKCFATYETEEEAIKTRNAINGTRWPASNPKILSAEFSTEEEFELHRSGADVQKVTVESLPPVQEQYESKTSQSVHTSDHRKREAEKRKDRDRYRMQAPVREWDKDKVLQESPERETVLKDAEGHRLSDKKERKDTKKRSNEDTPAKLLDDLFQKTKSAPCIYWLPLTEIQVVEREEALRQRKLEREKRQQLREQEDSEHRKRARADHKSRDAESRRSSTRSRSPTSRRR